MNDEEKTRNILDTYKFLKKENHIKSDQVMADTLSIPLPTLRSFLQNPLSTSNAKMAICSYFDLSPRDLDEGRLLKGNLSTESKEKEESSPSDDDEKPIVLRDTCEIFTSSLENNDIKIDDEIVDLDKRINRLLNFKITILHARKSFKSKKYQISYASYNSTILDLDKENIQELLESDLKNYIYLCELLDSTSGLSVFVDKIISKDMYNINMVFLAKELLKKSYPKLAKNCLLAIEQNGVII